MPLLAELPGSVRAKRSVPGHVASGLSSPRRPAFTPSRVRREGPVGRWKAFSGASGRQAAPSGVQETFPLPGLQGRQHEDQVMSLTRRQFLQTLALALMARPALAGAPSAIVVGAGMAGVTAAQKLRAAGMKVTVLEARQRLGGRIHTDSSWGFPVDLGAMWIEGTDGNPLLNQALKLGVKTVEDKDDWLFVDFDGRRLSTNEAEEYEELGESVQRRIDDLAEELDKDIPVAQAVKQVMTPEEKADPFLRRAIDLYVAGLESTASGPASRLSTMEALDYGGYEGANWLLPGGYLQVVEGLARGLDIKRSHRVSVVRSLASGVEVTTDKGTFSADFAVITLPLGVLKTGSVKFDPPLPAEKLAVIKRLEMGLLNKVVLKFDKPDWPGRDNFGYLSKTFGEFPEFLNWHRFSSKPVLICFVAGNYARTLEEDDNATQAKKAMAVLRKITGKPLPELQSMMVSRWANEPFSRGSYSYVPVGSHMSDYDAMAKPVGRLLFAGEATERDLCASVTGAYLSGLREAERAIKLYG